MTFFPQHPQPHSKCDKIASFFAFFIGMVIPASLSLTFAVFLYEAQKDSDLNDDCQDEKLKQGAFATSIILLVSVVLTLVRAINTICYKFSDQAQSKCRRIFKGVLDFYVVLAHLLCSISLNVVNNHQCGQLYDVAMSYYIVAYTGLVLFLFYFIYLIFATLLVTFIICKCADHCCSCDRQSQSGKINYPK